MLHRINVEVSHKLLRISNLYHILNRYKANCIALLSLNISRLEKRNRHERLKKAKFKKLWKNEKKELEKIKTQNRDLTSKIDQLKVADSALKDKNGKLEKKQEQLIRVNNLKKATLLSDKQKLVDQNHSLKNDVQVQSETNRKLRKNHAELYKTLQEGFYTTLYCESLVLKKIVKVTSV